MIGSCCPLGPGPETAQQNGLRDTGNPTDTSWIGNQFNLLPCTGTGQGRCQALTTVLQVQGRKNLRAEPRRATPSNPALFLRLGFRGGEDQWSGQAATQNNVHPPPTSQQGPFAPLHQVSHATSSFSALQKWPKSGLIPIATDIHLSQLCVSQQRP